VVILARAGLRVSAITGTDNLHARSGEFIKLREGQSDSP
jgi:hypothetical protein